MSTVTYTPKIYVWKLASVPAWGTLGPGQLNNGNPISVPQFVASFYLESEVVSWAEKNPGDYIVTHGSALHSEQEPPRSPGSEYHS